MPHGAILVVLTFTMKNKFSFELSSIPKKLLYVSTYQKCFLTYQTLFFWYCVYGDLLNRLSTGYRQLGMTVGGGGLELMVATAVMVCGSGDGCGGDDGDGGS